MGPARWSKSDDKISTNWFHTKYIRINIDSLIIYIIFLRKILCIFSLNFHHRIQLPNKKTSISITQFSIIGNLDANREQVVFVCMCIRRVAYMQVEPNCLWPVAPAGQRTRPTRTRVYTHSHINILFLHTKSYETWIFNHPILKILRQINNAPAQFTLRKFQLAQVKNFWRTIRMSFTSIFGAMVKGADSDKRA